MALLVGVFVLSIYYATSFERSRKNELKIEVERLNKIELQINEAVKKKEFDNALMLTNQLIWKLSEENEERNKLYDKQRENLEETILELKNKSDK